MNVLDLYDSFVFDLDGVLYIQNEPISSGIAFANRVSFAGKQRLFLTNNSKYTRADYRDKLSRLGVSGVKEEEILTSAYAAVFFLKKNRDIKGKSAFALGGLGLREELKSAGMTVLEGDAGRGADFVLVGWDTELTFDRLKNAVLAVNAGAEFIATNDDATFPAPDGLWPGAGAIVAAVERATGRTPVIVGKPHRYMMDIALARLGGPSERTVLIGDRLETDVLGGRRAGIKTALVLTGVSKREDVERSELQPDHVLESLEEWL